MDVVKEGAFFVIIHAGREIDVKFLSEDDAWRWADRNVDDQVFDEPNLFTPSAMAGDRAGT